MKLKFAIRSESIARNRRTLRGEATVDAPPCSQGRCELPGNITGTVTRVDDDVFHVEVKDADYLRLENSGNWHVA